jgi:hypothetical protein
MDSISDDDLEAVALLVDEQKAVPAVIVRAILHRLSLAEAHLPSTSYGSNQPLSTVCEQQAETRV